MNIVNILFYLAVIALIWWLVSKVRSLFKVPAVHALTFVNGAVKSFKSGFSLHLAIRTYKANLRSVKIANFFAKLFKKKEQELPLFYSNIPVGFDYVPLTLDVILRKKRLAFKSVVFVDEMSLLADKDLYRILDEENRQTVKEFFKLFGHETHGGAFISNSQALGDICIEYRRDICNYFYTHHIVKIPFFVIVFCREERYCEDNQSVVNVYDEDIDNSLKRVIVPKRLFYLYDQFAFSTFTDNLPISNNVIHGKYLKSLKATNIVSFNKYQRKEKQHEKTE